MNHKEIVKSIAEQIKIKTEERGLEKILIPYDGDPINHVLLMHICKKTQLPIVVYRSDLHQVSSGDFMLFAGEPYDNNVVYYIKIEIDNYPLSAENKTFRYYLENGHIARIAEAEKCLVLRDRTREQLYVRPYPRCELADLLPFIMLSKSQTLELYKNLIDFEKNTFAARIFEKYSNLDIEAFGTGITYKELEWLYQLNNSHYEDRIIEDLKDPSKHPKWFTFTLRQKQIIAKLHQIEKLTKYKEYQDDIPWSNISDKYL